MRRNRSLFGRQAPALGDNIADMDTIIMDQRPGPAFAQLLDQFENRLVMAEGDAK
jgi:DeoR family glycerol-3-phosphate regulon repressor